MLKWRCEVHGMSLSRDDLPLSAWAAAERVDIQPVPTFGVTSPNPQRYPQYAKGPSVPRRRKAIRAAERKRQVVEAYSLRARSLRELGFEDYPAYLASPLWAEIRERVLRAAYRLCDFCKRRASQVHHRAYTLETMRGEDDSNLFAICGRCHHRGEYRKGKKLSPAAATDRMTTLALRKSRPHSRTEAIVWREMASLREEFLRRVAE